MNPLFKGWVLGLIGTVLATQAGAQEMSLHESYSLWHITASMGMQSTEDVENSHGQSVIGRLAFQYMPIQHIGLELGIQSGDTMRFSAAKEMVDALGGVGVVGIIKPMMDVLITAKSPHVSSSLPLYASLKAGVAYRQLQMDRESLNDLYQIKPEFQAGLGYQINQRLDVSVLYQYVAGGDPKIQANPMTERGRILNIPNQKALFLGLTYTLG
ncbi:TPA: hypothetical protein JBF73_07770 [Legionella pneumophila]|nr:hypothetical protein [Legionella pneumophila]